MEVELESGERVNLFSHSRWLLCSQKPWASGYSASRAANINLLDIAVIPSIYLTNRFE